MEIFRNESVKEILRGPPGQNGLTGLTVRNLIVFRQEAEKQFMFSNCRAHRERQAKEAFLD